MSLVPLSQLLTGALPEDAIVAWRGDDPIRYGQFRGIAAAVSASTRSGERVALICGDSILFAAGFLGLAQGGAEIVLPGSDHPAVLDGISGAFDRLMDDAAILATPTTNRRGPVTASAIQVTFFTSGSTGTPKPVTRTLAMLEHEVGALNTYFSGLPGSGRVLATVSHQHLYGLTFKLLWPLSAGRAFGAETHQIWETVFAAGPEEGVVVSSPAHVSRLGGFAPLPARQRPCAVFCAGAPLGAAEAKIASTILGVLPTEIFGSTESGALATRTQSTGGEPWSLLPNVEIHLNSGGEAAFRSPQVADWVSTGDLVAHVPRGFHFLGRADRVVKVEGNRVSLAEVEGALVALPEVHEAAALVLRGPPSRLAAAVVPSAAGRQALEQQGHFRFGRALAHGLSQRLAASSRPKLWRFVASLPLRHMGKRDAGALAALFGQETA